MATVRRLSALAGILLTVYGGGLEARQSEVQSTPPEVREETKPSPQLAEPVHVEQSVAQNLVNARVQPVYPPQAREMRIQGTVVLRVLLNKKGRITQVTAVSGHPLLVPAAIDAVKMWKYKPYRINGRRVDVETDVVVNFKLQE